MKKKMALILFCTLIFAGLSGCKGKKPDRGQGTLGMAPGAIETPSVDLNTVASVTVNGKVIDKKMIDHETRQHSVRMKMKLPEPQFKTIEPTMRRKAVDSLINRTLLLQKADRAGIRIAPEELEAKFVSVRATYPGEEEFLRHLKKLGVTEDELKKELEVQLRAQKILDRDMGDKIKVTDEELEEYRKQNPEQFQKTNRLKVGEIWIKVLRGDSEEERAAKREKAEMILEALDQGADFGELAEKHSAGASQNNRGVLGIIDPGVIDPPLEKAVYALEMGQHSRVVETGRGYHIMKPIERMEPVTIEFEEVKEGVRTLLQAGKERGAMEAYYDELRESATITYEMVQDS